MAVSAPREGLDPQLQEVAESAPKHNHGNQERSQQEAITSSSSTLSVKRKTHESPHSQSDNLELEVTLKEKAGFTTLGHRGSLPHHSPPPPSGRLDATKRTPATVATSEDSNKLTPSDALPPLSHLGDRGGLQSTLSVVREGWTQIEKTVGDESLSGITTYHALMLHSINAIITQISPMHS